MIASSLVLFWPDGFTYAGRIGNDQGILFVHALVLYYLVRWNEEKQVKYLHWSMYASFTALIIKGSGVISIGATGIICLAALYRHEVTLRQLLRWPLMAFCAGCIALNFGRTLYYRMVYSVDLKWFINLNLTDIQSALVDNAPINYLYFDVIGFIQKPFFYSSPKGEPLFWNALLKTLLLGEWTWQSSFLASVLSAVFLLILVYVLWFMLCKIRRSTIGFYAPLLAMMFRMIGALMAARIQVPWACQANSRYIYGLMVILVIFYTKALETLAHTWKGALTFLGIAVALAFCVLSVLFILSEHPFIIP